METRKLIEQALGLFILLASVTFSACSSDTDEMDKTIESTEETARSGDVFVGKIIGGQSLYSEYPEEIVDWLESNVFISVTEKQDTSSLFSELKIAVVAKEHFPLKEYQTGDTLSFKIKEVIFFYPEVRDPLHIYTNDVCQCTIELCK